MLKPRPVSWYLLLLYVFKGAKCGYREISARELTGDLELGGGLHGHGLGRRSVHLCRAGLPAELLYLGREA